jgi:PIN domain
MASVLARSDLNGAVIVLDTNILDGTALLSDPASLALLFYLRRVEASLGLAEIVKAEWREHFTAKLLSELATARRALDWIDRTTELGIGIRPLDEVTFAQAAFDRRLEELGDLLLELPIEDAHWRQAGEMVISKRAPTKPKSQQFKDSLLWRAVLDIGREQKVVFVTADKGFLTQDGQGLQNDLAKEAAESESNVKVLTDLLDLLEGLRDASGDEISLMDDDLENIEDEFRELIDSVLEPEGLISRGTASVKNIEPFATPDPDTVAVLVHAEYELGASDDPEFVFAEGATVDAHGSAFIHLDQGPEHPAIVSVDYMQTIQFTPHGDIVRDWDFGSAKEFPGSSRLSSLIATDVRSTVERLRRNRGRHAGNERH